MGLRCPSDGQRTTCRASVAGPVFLPNALICMLRSLGKKGRIFLSPVAPVHCGGLVKIRIGDMNGQQDGRC
jgi:hypothetical protein